MALLSNYFGSGLSAAVGLTGWLLALFVVLAIWELIWKGIGLWKAGRNNQIIWFVFILILNTVGILPIIYLIWGQKKKVEVKRKR